MAQRTLVTFVDDLDGKTEAAGTVSFSLEGIDYEIDLSEKHADALREALGEYIGAARKVRRSPAIPPRRTAASAPRSGDEPSPDAVRSWARENGHEVSERGRISGSVMAAFQEAH